MITPRDEAPTADPNEGPHVTDDQRTRQLSTKQRRLERLRAWRAANREHLREYQRKWRTEHADRVRMHREREYERRRKERRRLRLRCEAQRRRRAIKRAEMMRRYQPF